MKATTCRIPDCEKKRMGKSSLCSMHAARHRRHGDTDYVTPTRRIDPKERFWAKVTETNDTGCWLYGGTILGNGYGQFSIGQIRWLAHRYSYTYMVAEIPEGLTLDHLCRVTACINPEHLDPVPMRENTRRGLAASALNSRKTTCPQGHEYDRVQVYANGQKSRKCSTCINAAQRIHRANRKAAA